MCACECVRVCEHAPNINAPCRTRAESRPPVSTLSCARCRARTSPPSAQAMHEHKTRRRTRTQTDRQTAPTLQERMQKTHATAQTHRRCRRSLNSPLSSARPMTLCLEPRRAWAGVRVNACARAVTLSPTHRICPHPPRVCPTHYLNTLTSRVASQPPDLTLLPKGLRSNCQIGRILNRAMGNSVSAGETHVHARSRGLGSA